MDDMLLPGISGPLVSRWYTCHRLTEDFCGRLGEDTRPAARRALATWWRGQASHLGPASGVRAVFDAGATSLLEILDFRVTRRSISADSLAGFGLAEHGSLSVPLLVVPWGWSLDTSFVRTPSREFAPHATWALAFNGQVLRLWDVLHGWSRTFLDFDIESVLRHDDTFVVFWALARAEALAAQTQEVARASLQHGNMVRSSLRLGVREALEWLVGGLECAQSPRQRRSGDRNRTILFEQALTIVYRLLFLLFAESRGLVPTWHPVYRRGYAVESLRRLAESPGSHRGLWAALQAISRLAHSGCHAGDLIVTPFNGRLFSPLQTPLAESLAVDDEVVARAVVALTTSPTSRGRERILFFDLGVEQLGAVYESVLDCEPAPVVESRQPCRGNQRDSPSRGCTTSHPRAHLARTSALRKSSGSFYTPREMTDYLVRQALGPLVTHLEPERILELSVLDPAMGSGAFLVAACHYLADAYEQALVAHRGLLPGDVTDDDRATYRRLVAQRCLYGVDVNPMAVQVARLSLWLATLASDRPLTFLDHHITTGHSLVGATLDDVARRPPGGGRQHPRRDADLPLFPAEEGSAALSRALPVRRALALVADDSVAAVRRKERWLAGLHHEAGDMGRLRRLTDLWCSLWFWNRDTGAPPTTAEYGELALAIRGHMPGLRGSIIGPRLDAAARIAARQRFFHFTLEFPEVFYESSGLPRLDGGFDAIVTNPPWEMVRADTGSPDRRDADRQDATSLLRFVRESGIYGLCHDGHPNLYQLFVERCLRLTRPGGRVGLVVPWGLASDAGSADLRRHLLDRCSTDALVGFDNTHAVFPIHRGVRFLLLSTSPGTRTRETRCWFGRDNPRVLDELGPGRVEASNPGSADVRLTPTLLARLAGPASPIPYVRAARDVRILEQLTCAFPALGSPEGWGARFGRELNLTDDRALLSREGTGLPVVEGKHLDPFRVRRGQGAYVVANAKDLPNRQLREAVTTWRLAYRDVASSTNRLTIIAALVPPRHVTVHTVFCLKTPLMLREQAFLCAVFNSFVANYVARLWVTTHVGATVMARIPVPRPADGSPALAAVGGLALELRNEGANWDRVYACVQAAVARLYGMNEDDFTYILGTFPLVADHIKQASLQAWRG
jgi:hypothetical protein